MSGFVLNQILSWLFDAVLAALDAVIELISDALLVTPELTSLPQVQALTGRSVTVVDTVFVLVFLAAGVLTMIAGGEETTQYTVKDLVPRAVVGFLAAHFSQLLCGRAITLANAVCGALSDQNVDRSFGVAALRQHLRAGNNPGVMLLLLVIVVLVIVLVVSIAFGLITRFGVLFILTAAAPLALACHALPHTDPVARLWWRSYLGVLAVPVLQAFTLAAGQWMLTDIRHILPDLPWSGGSATILNLLVVLVLLWTTQRIPSLVRRYVSAGGRPPNAWGTVVRVLAVRRVAGML
ncbi:hypothetical protein [Cryptosporangium phraense]|uniref:Type IV secretion system protein n=1 Tax=Cryptosporangium phraense TaxID=2593070 RepID=A0A545ANB6_9ACTN|nr:hypothetical protein [Cryptosporangium phraense]TQS42822.1 hypothetical protein FL583_22475 [Cryptosporangium phraense]